MPGLVFQNGSQLLNQQSHQWLSRCGIHELQDRCCCGFLSVAVCIEEKRCDGRQDLKVSGRHKGPQGVQGLDPNVPEALSVRICQKTQERSFDSRMAWNGHLCQGTSTGSAEDLRRTRGLGLRVNFTGTVHLPWAESSRKPAPKGASK